MPLTAHWKGNTMTTYKVAEIFSSINGEGRLAGQLAVFIRFCGCNLNCSFCDTGWANTADSPYTLMSAEEIFLRIKDTGIKNVTLTGGEPLLQQGISDLLYMLSEDTALNVEIETNGSIPIKPYADMTNRPSMTMDYKLPDSGMEMYMCMENYDFLQPHDTVKFVCGSMDDLKKAKTIITQYRLVERCAVYLSPVYGKIHPSDMVDFIKENTLNGVNLQLQLHKYIWDPNARGV